MIDVEWKAFDHENRDATTPPVELYCEPVWIKDELYHGVTIGYFDGLMWCTFAGSDDVHVTHWAPIEYPTDPAKAAA